MFRQLHGFEYLFTVLTSWFVFSLSLAEPKANRRDMLLIGSGPGSRPIQAADSTYQMATI